MTAFAAVVGFGVAVPAAQAQYNQGRPGPVYCASNDNRGARCQTSWRDSELSQQLSNARCIEGQTWGSDRGSVWVKNGCRGNFVEARRGWGGGGRPGPGSQSNVRCESSGNRQQFCPVGIGRGGVQLVRQISGASCQQGRTWGWNPNGIWVDRGCRADFRVDRR
ncbi:MAG: DUF3011 domain-containing protein [Rhodanobacter sp.]